MQEFCIRSINLNSEFPIDHIVMIINSLQNQNHCFIDFKGNINVMVYLEILNFDPKIIV